MAQQVKVAGMWDWQPEPDPQNPCKNGERTLDSTKSSSDLHMGGHTHKKNNFKVAGPEQDLDQEGWQMDGRGSGL